MTLSMLNTADSTSEGTGGTRRVQRSDKIEGAGTEYSVTGRKKVQIVASAPQV